MKRPNEQILYLQLNILVREVRVILQLFGQSLGVGWDNSCQNSGKRGYDTLYFHALDCTGVARAEEGTTQEDSWVLDQFSTKSQSNGSLAGARHTSDPDDVWTTASSEKVFRAF